MKNIPTSKDRRTVFPARYLRISGGEVIPWLWSQQRLSKPYVAKPQEGRLLNLRTAEHNHQPIALKAIGWKVGYAIKRITLPYLKANGAKLNLLKNLPWWVIESGSGSEVIMPSNVFDEAGLPSYQQAKVVIDEIENVDIARKQIESNGFKTTSLTDTLAEIDRVFKFFNVLLVSFGSIGMIVAILGMFNTLTISLLERTKEIGLMMALGARRHDMRKLFFIEAILISLAGSIIGIFLAWLAGRAVNLYINVGAKGRGVNQSFDLFSTPLWAILSIILFTIMVGFIVVYLPARRAERIDPIDALRRE